jgi:predicted  nucleic acid-binding Zn-ribbon protein
MRALLIAILLLSTLAVCGCGQRQASATVENGNKPSGSEQRGYLYSDDNSAAFIRWTEVNKKLNGQLQVFYTKGYAERQFQNAGYSFEGMCDGENVSINFTGSVWISDLSGKTWTGTLKGGELTLVVPTGAGTLAPVKFKTASVEEYNNAVVAIRRGLVEHNAQVKRERDEAARIAAEQQAVADAKQQVESAIDGLASATNDLLAGEDFDVVLKDYAGHRTEMQAHYQEMKGKAARKQLTTSELREVESDLRTVESDLRSIESDARSMEYRLRSMNRKIDEAREAIAWLRQSWGGLRQAMSANTTGTPSAPHTEADVSEQTRRAEAVIENALSLMQKMVVTEKSCW